MRSKWKTGLSSNVEISKEKQFFQRASSRHFHPQDVESLIKKKKYFFSWEELDWGEVGKNLPSSELDRSALLNANLVFEGCYALVMSTSVLSLMQMSMALSTLGYVYVHVNRVYMTTSLSMFIYLK